MGRSISKRIGPKCRSPNRRRDGVNMTPKRADSSRMPLPPKASSQSKGLIPFDPCSPESEHGESNSHPGVLAQQHKIQLKQRQVNTKNAYQTCVTLQLRMSASCLRALSRRAFLAVCDAQDLTSLPSDCPGAPNMIGAMTEPPSPISKAGLSRRSQEDMAWIGFFFDPRKPMLPAKLLRSK